jgi:hypothetical protein
MRSTGATKSLEFEAIGMTSSCSIGAGGALSVGKCVGQVRFGRKLTACAGKKSHKVRVANLLNLRWIKEK